MENICGVCLSEGGALVDEKQLFPLPQFGEEGIKEMRSLCRMCAPTLRMIQTFVQQSIRASQLLQDYHTNQTMYEDWSEYCRQHNIRTPQYGLRTVSKSQTLCLDVEPPSIVDTTQYFTTVTTKGDFCGVKSSHFHVEQYFTQDIKTTKKDCDSGSDEDDVNLKELFGERINKIENVNKKETSSVDDVSSLDPQTVVKKELEIEICINENADGNSLNDAVMDEGVPDDVSIKEDEDSKDTGKLVLVKRNEKKKKKKLNKSKTYSSQLRVTGLVMVETQISKESQADDMKSRKDDPEYKDSQLKCDICCLGFKFPLAFQTHMKKHSKDAGNFECWLCHQRFPSKARLAVHRRSYHAQRMWCGLCTRRFYNKTRLKDHVETHKGLYYKCDRCSRNFQSKGSLKRHLETHEDSADRTCQYCSKVLKSKDSFKSHILNHLDARQFVCTECPASFAVRRRLITHIQRKHKPRSSQHYCVECDFHFKSPAEYKSHLSTKKHTDPSLLKFPCNKCRRRYSTETQLSRHVSAMHDRVLQYSCSLCPARYATKHGVNFHRRTAHEGFILEKKYPCLYCNKAFVTKTIMENHIRTHTGEQPFQCKECGRAFSQRSSMRTHIKLVHLKKKKQLISDLASDNKTADDNVEWETQPHSETTP